MGEAAASPERRRSALARRVAPVVAPTLVGLAALALWEGVVRWRDVPDYLLPAPTVVAQKLADEAPRLASAWCVTFGGMAAALAAAVVGGVLLAALFTSSRWAELSFFPFAVVLQVTPLVAIAPLLLLWLPNNVTGVRLLCAWIVAFFPILANTAIGLRSVDPGLANLMRLYHASRWQRFRLLLLPSALPYFLGGLRVATNLALVGAVVAEFVTGAGTQPEGLATIVFEAQYLTDAPLLMAALGLISATGIAMYFATHLLSGWLLGGWHESRMGAKDQ